jgi:hypothetical protein
MRGAGALLFFRTLLFRVRRCRPHPPEMEEDAPPPPPRHALWFYCDNDASAFVQFQRLYLGNIFAKFLLAEGFAADISTWLETAKMGKRWLTMEDRAWYRTGPITYAPPAQEQDQEKVLHLLKEYHVPIPENVAAIPNDLLRQYVANLNHYMRAFAEMGAATLDDKKHYHVYEKEDYQVLLYKRYNGAVMIKGKIGEQEMIFCHGASKNCEIPSATFEVLRGEGPPARYSKRARLEFLDLEKQGVTQRWCADHVSIVDYFFCASLARPTTHLWIADSDGAGDSDSDIDSDGDAPSHDGKTPREKAIEAADPTFMRHMKTRYAWFAKRWELEAFFHPSPIPADFLRCLRVMGMRDDNSDGDSEGE